MYIIFTIQRGKTTDQRDLSSFAKYKRIQNEFENWLLEECLDAQYSMNLDLNDYTDYYL